ncbi:MAG: phosphopantetheine-binding protein [Pseudonocardiaceae bacterium]
MSPFTVGDLRKTVDSCLGGGGAQPLTDANLDTELDELGYDSLSIYEFVTKLQEDLHIAITDEEIDDLRTPRAMIDFINRRLAEAA